MTTPTKALQELRDEIRPDAQKSQPRFVTFSTLQLHGWSDRIDAILADLASATDGQGEAVAYQDRIWTNEGWSEWEGCSRESYFSELNLPSKGVEVRVLHTHPAARITEEQMRERFEEAAKVCDGFVLYEGEDNPAELCARAIRALAESAK